MSLTITLKPQLTVSTKDSEFNAVGNPVVYKMQRKDFTFNQINNNGGFVQFQINSTDQTANFANGDYLYIKSDNGVYAGYATQTAEAFSGGNTLITTDMVYVSAAPGGFVNSDDLRALYRVLITMYDGAGVKINVQPFTYSPDSTGLLRIDVATIIRSALIADISVALTAGVYEDTNAYQDFKIGYTEVWTGSAESETVDSDVLYGVFGAKQIPSLYGGNMYDYSVFDTPAVAAKFLTKLDTMVAWEGYPFLISFINSDTLTIARRVNGVSVGSSALGAGLFDAVITNHTADFTFDLFKTSGSLQLSEVKNVEVREACANPIMLMARNGYGGVIQWLFEGSQDYDFDYGDGRKAARKVLTAENLSLNSWEALQEFITLDLVYRNTIVEFDSTVIKTSTRISQQVYILYPDGSKVGVIVIPTRNRTETRNVKHRFEIEIEYPEMFTV